MRLLTVAVKVGKSAFGFTLRQASINENITTFTSCQAV